MSRVCHDTNLVLIGMPGAGKSTVGVLLAKATSRAFLDTDVAIQSAEGCGLQQIIDREGLAAFCRIEERHVMSLNCRSTVIATGGSVVYSPAAMRHLAAGGVIIHLDLDLPSITRRLTNLRTRGVVMGSGQTLAMLYADRQPLYCRYADISVDCAGKSHEELVREIAERLAV